MTHCEYVQKGRQGSPMQWFAVGHMSLVVTFLALTLNFPSRNLQEMLHGDVEAFHETPSGR